MRKIGLILDAGHGGNDPSTGQYLTFPKDGKFYVFTDNAGKAIFEAREGVSNRQIAERIIRIAAAAGITVVTVYHPTADRTLGERTRLANAEAVKMRQQGLYPVLFSLHSDAFGVSSRGPSQSPRGCSWFTSPGTTPSDAIALRWYEEHRRLAGNSILYRLNKSVPGQIDHDTAFWMLTQTTMPAVLMENLFFTNLQDAQLLASADYQELSARAAVNALLRCQNEPI